MPAKVHTVETVGAELLVMLPTLEASLYAETLARTLAAHLQPTADWRNAKLQREVPTELRGRITRLAKRKYQTVDTPPSDV